jgi:hypothetical protein
VKPPAKSVGRIVGVLLLVQLAGLIVPFVMLHPITRGSQVWLANAAASSFQIKTAVFLLFANTALTIGIAVAAWSVVRRHSVQMALWLVALAVIMFTWWLTIEESRLTEDRDVLSRLTRRSALCSSLTVPAA